MAIKFVDVGPEGEGTKPTRARQADLPAVEREPDAEASEGSVDPDLTHPKAAPKPRGRKKSVK